MMKRGVIALLTDFGTDDLFVGVMKGVILKINPQVELVDITHNIPPQDIFSAGFLLKSGYHYFPRGCIFLVVVDPGVGSERKAVVVCTKNYFFVGPDNGVLSLAAEDDGIEKIVCLENEQFFLTPLSHTFAGRDVFAPVAAYLSRGEKPERLGRNLDTIEKIHLPLPRVKPEYKPPLFCGKVAFSSEVEEHILQGEVIYIDHFGNLITNIEKDIFTNFVQDRKFIIKIKGRKIFSLSDSYQSVKKEEILAIFDSFNLLEISVNCHSAKQLLGVERGERVEVEIVREE